MPLIARRFHSHAPTLLTALVLVFISISPCRAAGPATNNADPPKPPVDAAKPHAATGIMVGELTPNSAVVQIRLSSVPAPIPVEADEPSEDDPLTASVTATQLPGAWGVVRFELFAEDSDETPVATRFARAFPQRDFIARVRFGGLKANTPYVCRTKFGLRSARDQEGPSASFQTLAGEEFSSNTHFVVVTGMNYAKFHGDQRIDRAQHLVENNTELPEAYSGDDKQLGYPALATILKQKPQFFIGTGDNVYYDTPDNPRAQTPAQMRDKWHEQFSQPRYRELFAKVPTYWEVDDHDYRVDDGDNAGSYLPLPETARAVLLEQLPYAPHGDASALTYRTHRVNKDLQIWLTENRFYRSANSLPDNAKKSVWGQKQKRWLFQTLLKSDAKFKVIISPTPMIGPDDLRKTDNHCDVDGFQTERDEFFKFASDSDLLGSLYLVCGDRHWQYHAVHPSGLEEFSCGALVDANSRLARMPGDPKGTDPKGEIKHLHTQEVASGGFLAVHVRSDGKEGPELEFRFHDELGEVLYSETKR